MRPHTPDQVAPGDLGRYDRLSPLELPAPSLRRAQAVVAPTVTAAHAAAPERTAVEAAPPAGGPIEVRYGLDTVAGVWVAQFFDGVSGEFVKSVPATRIRHQLAALRGLERGVDAEA